MFFNIGGAEILVIALVALIAIGPEQLPGVMRKVGGFVSQARSVTSGLRDEFMSGMDEIKEQADVTTWMGSGMADDPVVPRGFAASEAKKKADKKAEKAEKKAENKADETDTAATTSTAKGDFDLDDEYGEYGEYGEEQSADGSVTTADEQDRPATRSGAQLGQSDTTSTSRSASNGSGAAANGSTNGDGVTDATPGGESNPGQAVDAEDAEEQP